MSTPTTAPAPTTREAASGTATPTPPRTRWAAILWGLLFAAMAAISIWLLVDDDRRAGISDWALTLTPVTMSTLLILTVGVLLLVAGASALLRRVQRATTAGSAEHPVDDVRAE